MAPTSPYLNLEPRAYWRTGLAEAKYPPDDIFRPKWQLKKTDRIVTAGSCFAQHVGRSLRRSGFNVLDTEPRPADIPAALETAYGYGMYSARYGNIYTTRQLRQLLDEAWEKAPEFDSVWERDGRFHDALRPNVDPAGLESPTAVSEARMKHLGNVREAFTQADVFIFTLGLTEGWEHRSSGQVYPTAPGTVAGAFDNAIHAFVNFRLAEVKADLVAALQRLKGLNSNLKILLTVSPVPLTATASGQHVLTATTQSKSVLRACAGEMQEDFPEVDYFPSYEIITSSKAGGSYFEPNLRSVTKAAVSEVMSAFTSAHIDRVDETIEDHRKRREARREQRKAARRDENNGSR